MVLGRQALTIGACCVAFFFSKPALADYGAAVLKVWCDPVDGIFEVEPLIIWNEELDLLEPDFKRGKGKIRSGPSLMIQVTNSDKKLETRCRIAGTVLTARVDPWRGRTLTLFAGTEQIAQMTIGRVWELYDYVFRVRYTPQAGWTELCGRVGDVNAEKPWPVLDRKRQDTNCSSQQDKR